MQAGASQSRLGYRPGLDGLRAVAVVGVIGYHLGLSWVPGGFLGVDLFFVLSGFLITSLLIERAGRPAGLGIPDFYRRRARRLLPALALMLTVTMTALLVGWPEVLARARGDLLASAAYVTNWWFIVRHQSYFASTARPSPLEHLWSLAVEEQFYLVWPWVVVAVLRRAPDAARLARLGLLALFGALASTGWMAALAVSGDVPYRAGASRLYYGTDTHAMGLLLGAAAAAALAAAGNSPAWVFRRRAGILLDVAGAAGLAGVVLAMLRVSEVSAGLYRGGFLAFSAVALLPVLAASRAEGVFAAALGIAPLRWAGTRSYSLYLWHWPIFVVTRPGLDVPLTGAADVGLRLALTVAAAELSYRYVEQPIRRDGLRIWLARLPRFAGLPQRAGLPTGALATGMVAVFALSMTAPAAPAPSPLSQPAAASSSLSQPADQLRSSPPLGNGPMPPASARPHPVAPRRGAVPAAAAPAPVTVTAVGDSVMLGAAPVLRATWPALTLDAVEGRQPQNEIADVVRLLQQHRLGSVVILHIGSNGVIDPAALQHLLHLLATRHVVLVNDHVPDPWQNPNNAVLAQAARAHHNVVLVDWNRAASAHPGWLWSDGIHVRPAGAVGYASLVNEAVRGLLAAP